MSAIVQHVSDSILFLNSMPAKSVDVVITDPPYTAHVHENLCSGSLVGRKSVPKYKLGFEPLPDFRWVEYALRAARRWVVFFCAVEDFGRIQDKFPDQYVRGAIWYKSNAMGQLTGDRPATAFEGIAILHPSGPSGPDAPKKRWNGRGSYGVWRCNGTRGKKGRHPNEKPLDLCRKLVALFSDREEGVLDPFAGSAAIGHACVELGRVYVGLDKDPEWAAKAEARLAGAGAWGALQDATALALCSMRGDDPPE